MKYVEVNNRPVVTKFNISFVSLTTGITCKEHVLLHVAFPLVVLNTLEFE